MTFQTKFRLETSSNSPHIVHLDDFTSHKGVRASCGRPLFEEINGKCTSSFTILWRNNASRMPTFQFLEPKSLFIKVDTAVL